tara:strand:- start:1516 stop:2607 length:1092 start_codon:yes stop_codon:yes gene_type:complete
MSKYKKKILIATGGTGGHVFPAYSLSEFFKKNDYKVELITDKRGYKFLKDYKNLKLKIIDSATIFTKNPFNLVISFLKIFLAFLKSIKFLYEFKPDLVFGMGGYSSFPICIAAKIIGIPFIIYENNLIIGKTNQFLLPLSYKIFVSYPNLKGINKKYLKKVTQTGNIIREEILNFKKNDLKNEENFTNILVLGGSQAAKIFAEKLPNIFKRCNEEGFKIKIFQQCLDYQNKDLEKEYVQLNIQHEIFNFKHDILNYFHKADLVITRSGASMLAELLNCNLPIISIPLPTSADNHQLKNGKYFEEKGYGFLVEENMIDKNLFGLIKSIYNDKALLKDMKQKQKEHSDKKVFKKIQTHIEELFND